MAYCHLFPGTVPVVRIVNKWPGQEEVAGDSKVRNQSSLTAAAHVHPATLQIPSLVAYEGGRPIAFGAEALEHVGVDGTYVAKWFKVR